MQLISNLFIFPILLIAAALAFSIARVIGIQSKPHRYSSIDGLRGFLALFVFMHHASIWYYLTHRHQWGLVPNIWFYHFGPTSVAFFFMITAFLFSSKLIDARGGELNWLKLYVSRFLRIMPLYFLAIAWLFFMVVLSSGFSVKDPLSQIALQIGQWVIFMEPDINRIQGTRFLISGVQWSLAFEWLFYCSLPIIGSLFFRVKTPLRTTVLAYLFLMVFVVIIDHSYPTQIWGRLSPFLAGIVAAFLARSPRIRAYAVKGWVSTIVLLSLFVTLFFYRTFYSPVPYLVISLTFIAIACGNSFFGILTLPAIRLLGQISYGIYLLHGLLLFLTFYFIIGTQQAEKLSPMIYWGLITGVCAAMILVTSLTYRFIERTCLNAVDKATNRLEGLFKKLPHFREISNK